MPIEGGGASFAEGRRMKEGVSENGRGGKKLSNQPKKNKGTIRTERVKKGKDMATKKVVKGERGGQGRPRDWADRPAAGAKEPKFEKDKSPLEGGECAEECTVFFPRTSSEREKDREGEQKRVAISLKCGRAADTSPYCCPPWHLQRCILRALPVPLTLFPLSSDEGNNDENN